MDSRKENLHCIFEDVLHDYIKEMLSVKKFLKDFAPVVITKYLSNLKDYSEQMKETLKLLEQLDDQDSELDIMSLAEQEKEKWISNLSKMDRAIYNTPARYDVILLKSLYLNLFSIFDQFMGDFLYLIYRLKPELIDSSNKQYSASEVCQFSSIDEFKESIIDKEIDGLRRESYVKQFEILEKKFDMKLSKFDNWSKFVEITQRRNIIMHCGGIVSEQYLSICNEHDCNLKVKKNDIVSIDIAYLIQSIYILVEVGIKIVHVTWRKVFSSIDKLELADEKLNDILFNLLLDKETKLATEIGKFAVNQKKHFSAESKMFFAVNYCIALKQANKDDEISKIINSYDMSIMKSEYQLAFAVLSNQADEIPRLMKQVGNNSTIFGKHAYCTWPLFEFIRTDNYFCEEFENIFSISMGKYLEQLMVEENIIQENIVEISSIEEVIENDILRGSIN